MRKGQKNSISIFIYIVILAFVSSAFAEDLCIIKWEGDSAGWAITNETSITQQATGEAYDLISGSYGTYIIPSWSGYCYSYYDNEPGWWECTEGVMHSIYTCLSSRTWSYRYSECYDPFHSCNEDFCWLLTADSGTWNVICGPDSDGDGIPDTEDNCPNDANANQYDADSDGIGNICDNCLYDANSGQEDADSDGIGDVCDPCPNDDCDDGNPCTVGTCNAQTNECEYETLPDTSACDDGQWCTSLDWCEAGACTGLSRSCSSATDQCNLGVCDDVLDQCVPQPRTDGTVCDDSQWCTENDVCNAGECFGTQRDCSSAGTNQCVPGVCDDLVDQCLPQAVADGTPCVDDQWCTVNDVCVGGVCTTGAGRDCSSAGDQCNNGICDEGTDSCIAVPKPDGMVCSDDLFCTIGSQCYSGVCNSGSPYPCSFFSGECETGICDEDLDQCVFQPLADGTSCEDDLFCNGPETCSAGDCVSGLPPCSANMVCVEDGDQCLVDSDGDGTPDSLDNCPSICNSDQLDADGDGIGDVCDTTPGCDGCSSICEVECVVDADNDTIPDPEDNCPDNCNTQQLDADGDGIGDVCDDPSDDGCFSCGNGPLCEQEC